MSLFGRMFGGRENYPDLDPNTSAAEKIASIEAHLEKIAKDYKEPLEVVPGRDATYVFIGKPPKKFGVAWIEDGEVKNFQTLAKEQGVQAGVLQSMGEKLRSAYERNIEAERFTAHLDNCDITVTPCTDLMEEVDEIIGDTLH
ncbi:MAG: hypothetical protein C0616_01120 [Desulfuromonas sp.]|nr:MAG: hypothetical protein C0616_01120 [Desulfuromonas sp.]